MKNVGRVLMTGFLMSPLATFASPLMSVQKQEAIAMITYFIFMGLAVFIGYFIYQRRKSIQQSFVKRGERFRYRTYEMLDHGRKIVFVKRFKVVSR